MRAKRTGRVGPRAPRIAAGWATTRRFVARTWLLSGSTGWSPRLYEGFFARTRWGRSLREAEARVIVPALLERGVTGRRVLEVGAGTGAYTDLLARSGAQVEVREPSPTMRSYLHRRATRGPWEQVRIRDGHLPNSLQVGTTFAVVFAVGVLNYVADLDPALRALGRALDPDGVLIVNVPTAHRSAGRRYQVIELLGRRRVHRRSRTEVMQAAAGAGLRADRAPRPAGVTDLYVLVRPEVPAPRHPAAS